MFILAFSILFPVVLREEGINLALTSWSPKLIVEEK